MVMVKLVMGNQGGNGGSGQKVEKHIYNCRC